MSIPGEIAELGRIAAPDVAVITNVGAAHLEGLGSVEAVAQEKTDLLRALGPGGVAIVPSDCDLVAPHLAGLPCRVFRFGPSGDVTLDGQVQIDGMTQRFRVRTPTTVVNVSLPALGVHMVTNTLAALAVAEVLGFDLQRAAARIAGFSPVGQRMRPLQLGDLLVLEDCYNANPSSMSAAITTLSSLPGPHVAVLGDMLELGPEAAALHAQVGHEAAAAGVHWVLARGQFASDTVRGALAAGGQGSVFDDDLAMATAILAAAPNGGTVLVKGSRGARMERVIEALKGERHGSEGGGRVPMAL